MKFWLLAPVLIFLDQGMKLWARTELIERTIPLFSDVRFQLAFNKGFAFSLPAPQWILIVLAVVVTVLLLLWTRVQTRTRFDQWSAVLIASGALGNAIDRIIFSEVTDFLAFWNFPIFNVADVLVSVGVGLLLLGEIGVKLKDQSTKEK